MQSTKLPEINQNKTTAATTLPKNLFSISTQVFDSNVFDKALKK